MIAQPEIKSLIIVTPDEQHTTFVEPFTERELAALDAVMHVDTTFDHNLMLDRAGASYASFPRDDHELHEAMYLAHHGIIHEVAPHWYGFTTLGIARAQATAQHAS